MVDGTSDVDNVEVNTDDVITVLFGVYVVFNSVDVAFVTRYNVVVAKSTVDVVIFAVVVDIFIVYAAVDAEVIFSTTVVIAAAPVVVVVVVSVVARGVRRLAVKSSCSCSCSSHIAGTVEAR